MGWLSHRWGFAGAFVLCTALGSGCGQSPAFHQRTTQATSGAADANNAPSSQETTGVRAKVPAPTPTPLPACPQAVANPDGKTGVDGGDGFAPQVSGKLVCAATGGGTGTTGGATGGATGGSTGGSSGGSTGGSSTAGGSTGGTTGSTPYSSFKLGLLVNEPRCAMCHLTVNGDVAATADVVHWNVDAAAVMQADKSTPDQINGAWLCARTYAPLATDDAGKLTTIAMPIDVTGGVKQNYTGPELPSVGGVVQFPKFDPTAVAKTVTGTLKGKSLTDGAPVAVDKVFSGNLTITGDKNAPVTIAGDVFVSGDLVIKGYYTGVGSIYVGGRVYIPADLKAVNSVFPYPADRAAALALATKYVANHTGDALAIASANSIFIADLGSGLYDDPGYTPPRIPANAVRAVAGVDEVYTWYPGGQAGYEGLYEASISCNDAKPVETKSFNLVEAYLYSQNTVGGISRLGSWAINGGVITDSLHIVGRGGRNSTIGDDVMCDAPLLSPVHGSPMNANYVNYDFRLAVGLRLLSKMSAYYDH